MSHIIVLLSLDVYWHNTYCSVIVNTNCLSISAMHACHNFILSGRRHVVVELIVIYYAKDTHNLIKYQVLYLKYCGSFGGLFLDMLNNDL